MLFTGCGQPSNDKTQESPIITPTPTPTPTPEPEDPVIDPVNPTPTPTPVYGGEPYDQAIGNGNYTIHNFYGNDTSLTENNIIDGTDYYASKAETYVKDMANDFDNSLKNRSTTRNYFANLTSAIQNIDTFFNKNNPRGPEFDRATNTIDTAAQPYFKDIIKNLNTEDQRYAFYDCYRYLGNESFKEGLGTYREYQIPQMAAYNEEKESIIEDMGYDPYLDNYGLNFTKYGTDEFSKKITNAIDCLLNIAVKNMINVVTVIMAIRPPVFSGKSPYPR